MFTIGEFARHGRVSIRMLRHYDAIGLLRPAQLDDVSGYRLYRAGQLSRLNRIVALKDMGFTLRQIRTICDEQVSAEQLRGMLRLRSAQLEATMAQAASALHSVEMRLRSIENEGSMPTEDIVIKQLPAVRLAELSTSADSFDPGHIGPVIAGLFDELRRRMVAAGVTSTGPDTVYFETPEETGDDLVVHAGLPIAVDAELGMAVPVVTLPPVERAATIMHRGLANGFLATSQLMVRWVEAHGHRFDGPAREVTVHAGHDGDDIVAELQAPIA